jgi:predicted dehydrogenase
MSMNLTMVDALILMRRKDFQSLHSQKELEMEKRWKILVVGGGSIGERHIRCFLATGKVETAICETNLDRRKELVDQYELTADFGCIEDTVGYDPDVAVIATPAHLHVGQAIWFAERGVNLLIEKPLSTSNERISMLQTLIDKQNIVVGIAYVYRVHPALIAMQAAIASGRWGIARQLIVVGGQHFPTFRPQYREIYFNDPAKGGGAIQDALTHLLDCGQWLVGPIDRVCSDAEHMVLPGVGVEDTVAVLSRQSGAIGTYILNLHQAADELTMTVVCERGMCRFESHMERWRWIDGFQGNWKDEPTPLRDRDELYQRQAEAFLDSINGLRKPPCSFFEGLSTFAACQAVLISWREQCWVNLDKHEVS